MYARILHVGTSPFSYWDALKFEKLLHAQYEKKLYKLPKMYYVLRIEHDSSLEIKRQNVRKHFTRLPALANKSYFVIYFLFAIPHAMRAKTWDAQSCIELRAKCWKINISFMHTHTALKIFICGDRISRDENLDVKRRRREPHQPILIWMCLNRLL